MNTIDTDLFLMNTDDADITDLYWSLFINSLSAIIRLICVICVLLFLMNTDDADMTDANWFLLQFYPWLSA